jgi:hypothetical protein
MNFRLKMINSCRPTNKFSSRNLTAEEPDYKNLKLRNSNYPGFVLCDNKITARLIFTPSDST